jgi:hypothetical protein
MKLPVVKRTELPDYPPSFAPRPPAVELIALDAVDDMLIDAVAKGKNPLRAIREFVSQYADPVDQAELRIACHLRLPAIKAAAKAQRKAARKPARPVRVRAKG